MSRVQWIVTAIVDLLLAFVTGVVLLATVLFARDGYAPEAAAYGFLGGLAFLLLLRRLRWWLT